MSRTCLLPQRATGAKGGTPARYSVLHSAWTLKLHPIFDDNNARISPKISLALLKVSGCVAGSSRNPFLDIGRGRELQAARPIDMRQPCCQNPCTRGGPGAQPLLPCLRLAEIMTR